MSRVRGIFFVSVLATMLLLAACGDKSSGGQATPEPLASSAPAAPTAQWDSLLDQTLALEDENAALQVKVGGLTQEFQQQVANASGPETLASALKMMDKLAGSMGAMKDNVTALSALWDEMAALDVSAAHTTYAGQQKAIAELQLENLDLSLDFFAKERDMLDRLAKAETEAEVNDVAGELSELLTGYAADISELSARIEDEKQTSERFYKESDL